MKYYFSGQIESATSKRHIDVLKYLFPNIQIIQNIFFDIENSDVLKEGDTILFNSFLDLDPYYNNLQTIYVRYVELLMRNITIEFFESPECDSEKVLRILSQLNLDSNNDNIVNILDLTIQFYWERKNFERNKKAAALQASKKQGKQVGQPKGAVLTTQKSIQAKAIILEFNKDFNGTLTDEQTREMASVGRNTYYKYKKELKIEYKK